MSDQQSPTEAPKITVEMIAAAEQLIGLAFTADERKQMLDVLNTRLEQYAAVRSVPVANGDGLPLLFQPQIAEPIAADVPRTYPMSAQESATRPANLEEVAFYPLTKLAELVRTRQVTSSELTEMYLGRLKRYGPELECVVTLTEDLAMAQARHADTEIQQGYYRGPLHGIPWGAKDLLAAKGYRTTWGATPYKDQMVDLDATVVKRLDKAGAVLVAKLTMGALAYGDIWFGGQTKNPWDTTVGSGGSSAGPASATAAGLVAFAIGTETLGSIVNPSTRCGVTGLRPTFGRVSRHGAMTLSWSMDKIGPICRSVEDCALVLSAIYGPDGKDATVSAEPFVWNPGLDPRQLRVGYVEADFAAAPLQGPNSDKPLKSHAQLELANQPNNRAVLDVLRAQGIDLISLTLPDIDLQPLFMILLAEAAAAFDDLTRSNRDDLLKRQDDDAFPNLFRAARLIPAVEYIQANRIRLQVMQEMAALMQQVDVFVAPSFGGNTMLLTNLTGHPAVVVPNGFTDKHTPTSITFIGGLYREAEVLAVAKLYQDVSDFHLQLPEAFNPDRVLPQELEDNEA
jgi:Asp-tRNA(Asn)/Glu-tRNA(Gln) amidotransferase A subunit family amidase